MKISDRIYYEVFSHLYDYFFTRVSIKSASQVNKHIKEDPLYSAILGELDEFT